MTRAVSPGLHVAGMILDGDANSRVERPASQLPEDLDGALHVRFDPAGPHPVPAGPEKATGDGRSQNPGHPNSELQVFFGASEVGLEAGGGGTNASRPDVKLDTGAFRLCPDFLEVGLVVAVEDEEV